MNSLTDEQKKAFKLIDEKKNIFITSRGAGCGKTYLLNHIVQKYSSIHGPNKKIGITASTGVAAVLISGMTLHSWAGIGLGKPHIKSLVKNIKSNINIYNRWKTTDILIIDEISLISPKLFDKLEEISRIIRKNDEPFGGIQLIISGDWLQLPNIESHSYTFESKTWNKCINNVVYLTEIKRQENPEFQEVLNSIRIGRVTKKVKRLLRSRLNISLENKFGIIPTRLYALNVNVSKINNKKLNNLLKLTNCSKKLFKIKWVPANIGHTNYTTYLKQCNAPENLQLCVGAQVMLLYNKNQEQQLVNGSRGIIEGFNSLNLPIVKFLNGAKDIIEYKLWTIEIDNKIVGHFKQIPLKLAYATTIHKSQGSTLNYVEIDLSNIFELSQAYVGLSRVKSIDGLSILNLDFYKFGVNKKALKYYEKLEKSING